MRNNIKLKIGDKELGFSFGLAFLGELIEVTSLSLDEIHEKIQKNPFKWIPTLMFYSSKLYYERKGQEVDFTLYDISDEIYAGGSVLNETITKFMKAFTDSLERDVPKDEADEGPKNNGPKKK